MSRAGGGTDEMRPAANAGELEPAGREPSPPGAAAQAGDRLGRAETDVAVADIDHCPAGVRLPLEKGGRGLGPARQRGADVRRRRFGRGQQDEGEEQSHRANLQSAVGKRNLSLSPFRHSRESGAPA